MSEEIRILQERIKQLEQLTHDQQKVNIKQALDHAKTHTELCNHHREELDKQHQHHRQKVEELSRHIDKLNMEIERLRRQLECTQERVLDIDARQAAFLQEDNKRLLLQLQQLQDSHEHLKRNYRQQEQTNQQNLDLLRQLYMHMRKFRQDEEEVTNFIEDLVRKPMSVLLRRFEQQVKYLANNGSQFDQ